MVPLIDDPILQGYLNLFVDFLSLLSYVSLNSITCLMELHWYPTSLLISAYLYWRLAFNVTPLCSIAFSLQFASWYDLIHRVIMHIPVFLSFTYFTLHSIEQESIHMTYATPFIAIKSCYMTQLKIKVEYPNPVIPLPPSLCFFKIPFCKNQIQF